MLSSSSSLSSVSCDLAERLSPSSSPSRRRQREMDDGEILQLQVSRRRRHADGATRSRRVSPLAIAALYCCLCCSITIPMPSNQVPARAAASVVATSQQQLRSSGDAQFSRSLHLQQAEGQQISALPLSSSGAASAAGNNQHQHPDAPKLIPLSALDRYQEGADLRLFCSASVSSPSGSGGRQLHFEWRKNQVEQLSSGNGGGRTNSRLQISSMDDDSASVLRINHLDADDSANYTCLVRNQHGSDSSTVRVSVNVRLKWIKEPPSELQVRAGKSVQLECDASGAPAPIISWTSVKDQQTIHSKVLRIDRVQVGDSGLYECKATSAAQPQAGAAYGGQHASGSGEQLRKVVRLVVNGK